MKSETNEVAKANYSGEYLLWKCGEHLFGLELAECQEIVNEVSVTRLPRAPHYVRGLANLRGNVISIIDLEVLLGYKERPAYGEKASIVRIRTNGYPIAVTVDSIRDTIFLGEKELESTPANLSESETMYISKVAKTSDGLVLVPDLRSIHSKNQ